MTQFINELRRVSLPSSIPVNKDSDDASVVRLEEIKHLTLGSRKYLCINKKVASLKSVSAMNEKCLELQQSGKLFLNY